MSTDLHDMLATTRSARRRLDRRRPVPVEMLGEFLLALGAPLAPVVARLAPRSDATRHATLARGRAGVAEAAR
ncbi:hypothetical protein [Nocardioides sp. R-C-SC26]|uniref:hypothetical protein n=1 Tax=Nocardioides sp. R-C-SC26 TaxID=2870414 RepID=UPI001E6496A0|nr:hypothetical protein [Nocardioides sp. R-C-SC26]